MTHASRGMIVTLALAAMACSGSSPTSPTPAASIAGTWTGTLVTPSGEIAVRLELQGQVEGDGERVAGRYEFRDTSATATGTVSGLLLRGTASLALTALGPPRCPSSLPDLTGTMSTGLHLAGNRLSGTAAWLQCGAAATATVALAKS